MEGQEEDLQLTIWKPDPLIATFRRVSSTSSMSANVTVENGSIFIYELNTPLEVHPGYIVGVEVLTESPEKNNNILCLDASEKGVSTLSYMRPFRFNQGFRPRDIYEQTLTPLISTVIGKLT